MLKQMNEFFQAMNAWDEASSSRLRDSQQGGNGDTSSGSIQAKPVRLEFRRYDESEDPTIWLC